jgi:hypothetical protein
MNKKNPQAKSSVNVAQGPRTGNAGTPSKRNEFMSAKSETGSERSRLADFVMDALGMRGKGMQPYVNPALENISSNSAKTTGISRNSTADGSRAPAKNKPPKSKG